MESAVMQPSTMMDNVQDRIIITPCRLGQDGRIAHCKIVGRVVQRKILRVVQPNGQPFEYLLLSLIQPTLVLTPLETSRTAIQDSRPAVWDGNTTNPSMQHTQASVETGRQSPGTKRIRESALVDGSSVQNVPSLFTAQPAECPARHISGQSFPALNSNAVTAGSQETFSAAGLHDRHSIDLVPVEQELGVECAQSGMDLDASTSPMEGQIVEASSSCMDNGMELSLDRCMLEMESGFYSPGHLEWIMSHYDIGMLPYPSDADIARAVRRVKLDEMRALQARRPKRKPKRRAHVLKPGTLTLIPYGYNERLMWTQRIFDFVGRMRKVLGDRQINIPWGGSILDSIVGVFLTQNVSDTSSSKAIMQIACRYPAMPSFRFKSSWKYRDDEENDPVEFHEEVEPHALWIARDCSDMVEWSAVYNGEVQDLAECIKCRGMHNRLAARVFSFLDMVAKGEAKKKWESHRAEVRRRAEEKRQREEERRKENEQQEILLLENTTKLRDLVGRLEAVVADLDAADRNDPNSSSAVCEPQEERGSGTSNDSGMQRDKERDGLPKAETGVSDALLAQNLHCEGPNERPSGSGVADEDLMETTELCTETQCGAESNMEVVPDSDPEPDVDAPYSQHQEGDLGMQISQSLPVAIIESNTDLVEAAADDARPRHKKLSLDWLHKLSDEEVTEFLTTMVEGLGRKSAACVNLLCMGRRDFPVDVNVARVCARLGWVPLQSAEAIEELDDYAPEEEVHKYLHKRLLHFDFGVLYELHYQMITLGKVFCSKRNPRCGTCPLRECCEYAKNGGRRYTETTPQKNAQRRMHTGHKTGTNAGKRNATERNSQVHSDLDSVQPGRGTRSRNGVKRVKLHHLMVGETVARLESIVQDLDSDKHTGAKSAEEGSGSCKVPDLPDMEDLGVTTPTKKRNEKPHINETDRCTSCGSNFETPRSGQEHVASTSQVHSTETLKSPPSVNNYKRKRERRATETSSDGEREVDRILELLEKDRGLMEAFGLDDGAQSRMTPQKALMILDLEEDQRNDFLAARKQYRSISKLIHPDKCAHAKAGTAFAALNDAFKLVTSEEGSADELFPDLGMDDYASDLKRTAEECDSTNDLIIHPGPPTLSRTRRVFFAIMGMGKILEPLIRMGLPPMIAGDPNPYFLLPDPSVFPVDSQVNDEDLMVNKWDIIPYLQGGRTEIPLLVLMPSRTALGGKFPLNGTFFQVNELFLCDVPPIRMPIEMLTASRPKWRPIYFGSSVSQISLGMRTPEVAQMFHFGFVCIRSIDMETGAPKSLPKYLMP